jgi:hypothetical protein
MRNPDAPFLELGFYFRERSGREALNCLATTLMTEFNAVPKHALVTKSTSASLFRADEGVDSLVTTPKTNDLRQLLDDSSRFVKKIIVDKGTRIVSDAREFVVVLPIESSESENEGNSVAIWVEGEVFSRACSETGSKREQKVAAKALDTFKTLISYLRPTYAAITVDYGLETPCDLRLDSRSYAFFDFYLSRDDFGESFLAGLKSKYPNSAYDDYEGGQITLTTSALRNVLGVESAVDDNDDNGYDLSQFVGRNIAKILT